MRYFLAIWLAAALAFSAAGASTTVSKKKTPAKKRSTAIHRTSTVRKASTATSKGKKGAPVKHAVTWRNRQLTPTADRYKEIQQALAAKGYLQPDQATGVWSDGSSDALRRFQEEQNIDATGKINSLSLIALGLGPKHDAIPTAVAAPDEPGR
jgi:peptidoglycan hydrolase-like protein with peptidoglycan-binding domain